jgi:acetoin utilization deacetylase AcuC-like enzyme
MTLLYYTHPDCLEHEMTPGHPERPDRLRAIQRYLDASGLAQELRGETAPLIEPEMLTRVHTPGHIAALAAADPETGLVAVDPDTSIGPGSLRAGQLAAGAVVAAVDAVLAHPDTRAFCAVRPPGHHAEADASMGFCLYNSIALGAVRALAHPEISRVAILDFDVHHGNGTVDIFKDNPAVLVCSSFQHPFYPYRYSDIERENIVNTPLAAGAGGAEFRRRIEMDWLPALERHKPELILVSAGFDAHKLDPLASLELDESDFRWVTDLIVAAASNYASGRLVSALEGGYDLDALARSVHAHVESLV